MTPILDMTAGSRMMWWDKSNPLATFVDKRSETFELKDSSSSGGVRTVSIKPDIVADWTVRLPFDDNSFYLVIFDPPHLIDAGPNSWLRKKYGVLDKNSYQADIKKGFEEAMRVLRPFGTLVFKWSDDQVKLKDALAKVDSKFKPLFGSKRNKTHWLIYMKTED
jgi:hypothetical protein